MSKSNQVETPSKKTRKMLTVRSQGGPSSATLSLTSRSECSQTSSDTVNKMKSKTRNASCSRLLRLELAITLIMRRRSGALIHWVESQKKPTLSKKGRLKCQEDSALDSSCTNQRSVRARPKQVQMRISMLRAQMLM